METPALKQWSCPHCDAVLKTKHQLYTHNRSLHKDKVRISKISYKCQVCCMDFSWKRDLQVHLTRMHEETRYTCDMCPHKPVFDTAYKYSLHLYEHDSSKGFCCPICSFTTPRKNAIGSHIYTAHFKRYEHVCKYCGKRFNNPTNRMQHEECHEGASGTFRCVVCQRGFSEHDKLTMHQLYYHRVPVRSRSSKVCDRCGKSYAKQQALELHLKNFHGEDIMVKQPDKNTWCYVCLKHYTGLSMHMRTHADYKPYKCDHCEKSFRRRDCLLTHEAIHTGERPFACTTCGIGFVQKAKFHMHMRAHNIERPFKCHLCNCVFITKLALKRHLKVCSK